MANDVKMILKNKKGTGSLRSLRNCLKKDLSKILHLLSSIRYLPF